MGIVYSLLGIGKCNWKIGNSKIIGLMRIFIKGNKSIYRRII